MNVTKIYKTDSNPPAGLYRKGNTHNFANLGDIATEDMNSSPIIYRNRTFTYNPVKVTLNYLRSFCKLKINHQIYAKCPNILS